MSFNVVKKIPSADEIIKAYPLTPDIVDIKKQRDIQIKDIISGKSNKLLIIIGPCSADNEDSLCDYVNRLSVIQDKLKDKLVLVPRIYTNKPRSTGEGYKGILHQPNPEKAPDMEAGLIALRKMHIRSISESCLSAADEMLYPENHTYLDDVLSYVAVGARSVENQQHRLTASGLDVPVGMKNPTSGNFSVMLNSVHASQIGHNFSYQSYEVKTTGNPYAHTVLRGAVNKHGQNIPNYHYEDLILLCDMYAEHSLNNPAIIIDTNHANSGKKFNEQPRIVNEVLNNRKISNDIRKIVKGFMIESYIEEGCQKVDGHIYGKSITDACLGWQDTEKLLYSIAENI